MEDRSAKCAPDGSKNSICMTVAKIRFAFQNVKTLACSEQFWNADVGKMRRRNERSVSHKNRQNIEAFGATPDLCGRVSIVSAVPSLVDLECSWLAGLKPAVAKPIGTAARSKT